MVFTLWLSTKRVVWRNGALVSGPGFPFVHSNILLWNTDLGHYRNMTSQSSAVGTLGRWLGVAWFCPESVMRLSFASFPFSIFFYFMHVSLTWRIVYCLLVLMLVPFGSWSSCYLHLYNIPWCKVVYPCRVLRHLRFIRRVSFVHTSV